MKTLIITFSILLTSLNIKAQTNLGDSTATNLPQPKFDSIVVYEMANGVYCTTSYSFFRKKQLLELQKTKKVIIIKNNSK